VLCVYTKTVCIASLLKGFSCSVNGREKNNVIEQIGVCGSTGLLSCVVCLFCLLGRGVGTCKVQILRPTKTVAISKQTISLGHLANWAVYYYLSAANNHREKISSQLFEDLNELRTLYEYTC
jgi:hypothetical protein